MTAGQAFVQKIRPAGCVLFLMLAVLVTAICFTAGRDPVRGYEAPQSTEYYQQHPDELVEELQENFFPQLPDYETAVSAAQDGTVLITIDSEHYYAARAAVLRYYDEELFTFAEQDG